MKFPSASWPCHVACLLVFSAISVSAQSVISGCVEDSTHAAISGATIILDGPKRFQSLTGEKGCFTVSGAANGRYQLTVLAEAFAPFERVLEIQNHTNVDTVVLESSPSGTALS